ncbi:MAG TPA: substrate-binding domain-containing protein [Papillibacter sp.]|jgi:ABC-type sugar transport system substrate-binding protein|nr:substrate-binding domain-containing protein [Papillibacter sp.]
MMKKVLALLIALCTVFTLAACNRETPTPSPSPTQSAQPTGPAMEDISKNENSIGFFSSGVDPASRKTYNVVWAYMRPMALFQNIADALVRLEPVLNFKTTSYCANGDIDAMIQNIQIYASQNVDGFLVVIDPTAADRVKEVLDETNIPYIAMLNSVRDENGSAIVPCVGIEGVIAGEKVTQWLYDNYKTYWGDIDPSEIALLDYNFSPNVDFNDRYTGAMNKFKELLPNNKVFTADGVSGKLDEQTGYDLASAILAANPDVKYWFVPACLELYAQGCTRAVETLGMEDKVLITCVGSDILTAEWDNGYEGCWVSCLAISDLQYTVPGICGLVAMMDGKATADSLWSYRRAEGDQKTFYNILNEMVTKDTYKDFLARVQSESGL